MSTAQAHLLLAPDGESSASNVPVNSDAVQLDALGPMVVNSDGTLSRIANWQQMTDAERERTMRVLAARNKIRIARQEKATGEPGSA